MSLYVVVRMNSFIIMDFVDLITLTPFYVVQLLARWRDGHRRVSLSGGLRTMTENKDNLNFKKCGFDL